MAELKTNVAVLQTDVAELKDTTEILKADVAELKTNVAVLQTDVSELKDTSDVLTHDVSDLNTFSREAREEMRRLNYKITLTNQKIDDLRLDFDIFKASVKREFHSLNDKMDTVIEVLREREMLPQ